MSRINDATTELNAALCELSEDGGDEAYDRYIAAIQACDRIADAFRLSAEDLD